MLWSGLVSQVGASYRVNLIVPFPLGWTSLRKIDYEIMSNLVVKLTGLLVRTKLRSV